MLHHLPSSVPVTEETGLFKSRKDVCDGAGLLSLLFFKPAAGMWICQDDRQLSTYLSSIPPSHLCLSLTPQLTCCSKRPWDSSCNPGASSSPFSLF